MEQLLFTGGTAWEVAPPPRALRPAVLEFLHALVATQASLTASRLRAARTLEHELATLGWACFAC